MTEMKMPKVYGDRLIPILIKVDREMQVTEVEFVEDETLSTKDDDLQDYGRIQNRMREIYEDLARDRIRGETAVERLNVQIFYPFEDLTVRMVRSGKFPEFTQMYDFIKDL